MGAQDYRKAPACRNGTPPYVTPSCPDPGLCHNLDTPLVHGAVPLVNAYVISYGTCFDGSHR